MVIKVRRVWSTRQKNRPDSDWTYIGELYERRIDKGKTTYIFHAGGVDFSLASTGSQLVPRYLLNDALGRVATLTDKSGLVTERRYYEPFSNRISP